MAGTNTEEGSASFQGFVPEVSPTRGAGSLPPFALRDESGTEASYRGSDIPLEETNAGASTTTSPVPPRSHLDKISICYFSVQKKKFVISDDKRGTYRLMLIVRFSLQLLDCSYPLCEIFLYSC